ncbi:hypothetical protein E2C01_068185 [Portunus trituberculatus]|uniref:Uncharacterized protein n=1 Tax=Portunus trituberculatus TaxID=210409 RepID=A0A5B7HVL7_PORTR|nr:hypothetical protein [Portunus trituberculatus]
MLRCCQASGRNQDEDMRAASTPVTLEVSSRAEGGEGRGYFVVEEFVILERLVVCCGEGEHISGRRGTEREGEGRTEDERQRKGEAGGRCSGGGGGEGGA